MNGPSEYPKILLVSSAKIKVDDPAYLLVRTEFGDWPKARLAQICASDDLAGHGEFCGRNYQLQIRDRCFGSVFRRLRGQVSGMIAPDSISGTAKATAVTARRRWAKGVKKRLGDWLIASGMWELFFHVRLSRSMTQFIEDFGPDLIYCQGYSLGFTTLPMLIGRHFKRPICFQTTDDWPSYTYRHSPVGWLLRRRARELVRTAKVRMAFGTKMQQVFEKRYRVPFHVTHHADDPARFPSIGASPQGRPRIIAFTGSLGLRRYEAIDDLVVAIKSLKLEGMAVAVRVYSSGMPKELPDTLRSAPEVTFLPLPSHEALPSVLAEADVLFLPESFSVEPGMIELSISTKCHLYMMSGRPILVYGPPFSGTIDYALNEGWAAVVCERNPIQLRATLARLLTDSPRVEELSRRASAVVARNHDMASSRTAFLETLTAAIPHWRPSAGDDQG